MKLKQAELVHPVLAIVLAGIMSLGEGGIPIHAQSSANSVTSIKVNIVQGADQRLIAGSPARTIVAQVVDQAGKPVSGAVVNFILGTGGTTLDGASSMVGAITNESGQASLPGVRPNATLGDWSIRVSASYQGSRDSTDVRLTNVEASAPPPPAKTEGGTPASAAPASSAPAQPTASTPPPKKSHTALIVIILVAAAAGGAAAARGGKGGSSSGSSGGGGGGGGGSTPTLTIGVGSGGGFSNPSGQH
jgi:hypothetical protein